MKKFDVVICGGGPAGMTAAIYAQRGGLTSCVIEKQMAGGQIVATYEVENYPGFKLISGAELRMQMQEHAESLGSEFIYDEFVDIDTKTKTITLASGEKVQGKYIVLSLGASNRKIARDGSIVEAGASEQPIRGLSYCATCDGAFYKNKVAMVMGGGNTAVEDALYLEKFAKKVYLVHRRDQLRAVGVLVDNLMNSKVEVIWDSVISEIKGENKVSSVVLENVKTKEKQEIELDGVFIAIGQIPQTKVLEGKIELTKDGYIVVNEHMKTSVDGIYSCGDANNKELRQIITACADGAIAVDAIIKDSMNK